MCALHAAAALQLRPPVETPALGCLHPDFQQGQAYFDTPASYMQW